MNKLETQIIKLVKLGYSASKIAQTIPCSKNTVTKYLKKNNLQTQITVNPEILTLIQNLIKSGLTTKEIAKQLQVSPTTIHKYTTNYLKIIPNTKRNQNFKDCVYLTQDQKEILLGSLLGDMSMEKRYQNSRFSISHGGKQEKYFDHKCQIFSNFIKSKSKKDRYDTRTQKSYYSCKAHSITNACLNEIYELVYPNNKKKVSINLLNCLSAKSLAYWFMDDGTNKGVLATNSFSKEECELIQNWLKEKWDISTTLELTHKNQPLIYFTKQGKQKFWELTHMYFIPSMLYKIENWNP